MFFDALDLKEGNLSGMSGNLRQFCGHWSRDPGLGADSASRVLASRWRFLVVGCFSVELAGCWFDDASSQRFKPRREAFDRGCMDLRVCTP